METSQKKLYEGMFLVDSALAATDWNQVQQTIEKIFERNGAEVVSFKKWDDRKLTYEIAGAGRGTYILTYFRAPTSAVGAIERSVQLAENILRVLILRTDAMSEKDMAKPTPLEVGETPAPIGGDTYGSGGYAPRRQDAGPGM